MKINFNQVPHADVDAFGDDNLLGPDASGNFYYNQIEYGTNPGGMEDFVISDTCGRSIPVSTEAIPDLIRTLQHIYGLYNLTKATEIIIDFMESDTQGYVDDFEIKYDGESFQATASWPFGH